MTFELCLEADCGLAESPVWIEEEARLLFVDIPGRTLHWYEPRSGAHRSRLLDEEVGCVAPIKGGGLIAGTRSGIWRLSSEGDKVERLAENPEPHETNRFNDGKCDPRGRFLVGTLDEPKRGGRAGLYRFDRRGLHRLKDGVTTSNGLAFSPDGGFLYHSDTPRFRVWRHRYDAVAGAILDAELFVALDADAPDRARPDGAATDAEGAYWTALFDGGRLHRYDPAGRLLSVHPLPARRPTMPAFGGAGLDRLYVTTATADGAKGALFRTSVDAPGARVPPFDPEA